MKDLKYQVLESLIQRNKLKIRRITNGYIELTIGLTMLIGYIIYKL